MSGVALGSAVGQNVGLAAAGKFVLQSSPVWAWNQGFDVLITRTAAGHYKVTMAAPSTLYGVRLTSGGADGTATAPRSYWYNSAISGGVLTVDIFVDVNTAGTGALADIGDMLVEVIFQIN